MHRLIQIFGNRFYCLFLFLLSGCLTAEAQPASDIEIQAGLMLERGDTLGAIHEYYRYAFFAEAYTVAPFAYYTIGTLWEDMGKWEEAVNAYRSSSGFLMMDSLYFDAENRIGYLSYLNGKNGEALQSLGICSRQNHYLTIRENAMPLFAAAQNHAGKWEEGKAICHEYFSEDENLLDSLDRLYDKALRFKPRNPKTASILNLVLPGTGLLYAGKPGQAFLSLALNGASIALTVWAAIDGRYLLAVFSGLSFFQKFWMGGEKFARDSVDEWNARKQFDHAKAINLLILEAAGRK